MTEADGRHAAGAIFFAVCAVLFLGGAYAMWPAVFVTMPFSEMALSTLLRAAATGVLALVGLEFLGALAVVMLAER